MAANHLDLGKLHRDDQTGPRPRHLLALTGGGFRGVFTAQVLARMEAAAGQPLAGRFDLIGGTSIGGILAIGISCGIAADTLLEMMREHGPGIFTPKRATWGGTISSHYDPTALRGAIVKILGKPISERPFADLPARLVVVAVDERSSRQRVFKTSKLAGEKADTLPTIDVALATSAAPSYFPPHPVGEEVFVDGGLIANAPDMVLVGEALRAFTANLDELHLCSIGTARNPRVGHAAGAPGKADWFLRHGLIDLIMDAQVALALEQVKRLALGSNTRIDRAPLRRIELDDVAPKTCDELIRLANDTITEIENQPVWQRLVAHQAA